MISYRAHISPYKQQALQRCFVNGVVSQQAAKSCKVKRHTADHWYRIFRQAIFEHQSKLRRLSGEVEADHAYFGARGRKRYKKEGEKFISRPRQKFMVFGFLERGAAGAHRVRTYVIPKADTDHLMPLTRLVVEQRSRIYTDSWRSFSGLEDDGYVHRTINHRRKQFAKRDGEYSVHTGTLDQYWKFARSHLARFGRLHPQTIHLLLKECEFRYENKDVGKALKKIL